MKKCLFFFLIVFAANPVVGQKKLRQAAWQQRVNYDISVSLDDRTHYLRGFEKLRYINNSPDTLRQIYIHVWPNAYKNTETAMARQLFENGKTDFYFAEESDRGFIDSLDFMVNNSRATWKLDPQNIDICLITLTQPLLPGGTAEISTPFRVKIPKSFSRLGHEEQSYQITQWYPKPAVYDVNGWNPMPYLDQGEFYSEFGTFDVKITVPSSYVVASTGILRTEEERNFLEHRLTHPLQKGKEFDDSPSGWKTIQYTQDSIHDFAWFADKSFNIVKDRVTLNSGRVVETFIFSRNPVAGHLQHLNKAITCYSDLLGEYPYSHATVVEGALKAGGGMEYPMITVIESANEQVIVHELGHNWFYGILASDERTYPWMDEGFNSFYEQRCIREYKKEEQKKSVVKAGGLTINLEGEKMMEAGYIYQAGDRNDQPIGLPSGKFTSFNYGIIVYGKTSLALNYLRRYLGEPVFDKSMKNYYEAWKFRHPLPGDLREAFEKTTGKDLSWFFDDLINTDKLLDYKIIFADTETDLTRPFLLKIENKGGIPGPFQISAFKEGKVIQTVWYEGFNGEQILTFPRGDYDRFKIDSDEIIPEINRHNNSIKTSGILRRMEKIRFQFLADFGNPDRTRVFWTPLWAWNMYNKNMLGVAFYNSIYPKRKFEYALAPLFSLATHDLNGYAGLTYNMFPKKGAAKKIEAGVNGARFRFNDFAQPSRYNKVAPYAKLHFRNRDERSPMNSSLELRYINIRTDRINKERLPWIDSTRGHFVDLAYRSDYNAAVEPTSFMANLQYGRNNTDIFIKGTLEAKTKVNYGKKGKDLGIRVFGGTFFYKNQNIDPVYFFRLSGNSGPFDYLFDDVLMGRGERYPARNNIFTRQIRESEGFLKALPTAFMSDRWLLSVNLRSSLPGKLPIKAYADAGTYSNARNAFHGSELIVFTGGLMLTLPEDVLEVYFPLFYSTGLKDLYANNSNNYWQRITFMLNLKKLNPLKLVRDMKF